MSHINEILSCIRKFLWFYFNNLNNVILNKAKKSYKAPEIYSSRQISVIQTSKDAKDPDWADSCIT